MTGKVLLRKLRLHADTWRIYLSYEGYIQKKYTFHIHHNTKQTVYKCIGKQVCVYMYNILYN